LNQAGVVFVFANPDTESGFHKFTFAIEYDQIANYDNAFFAVGDNTNSIDGYFLSRANGVPLDFFQIREEDGETLSGLYRYLGTADIGFNNYDVQNAFLGYQTFIFDPVDSNNPDNTEYVSNIAQGSFYQEYSQFSTGTNGKVVFNVGTQFKENLYLGFNLNAHYINYERTTVFYEENQNAGSEINKVYFENTLATYGSGISVQLGGIYKFNDMFRMGLSYTSPAWYVISEETLQYLETFSESSNPQRAVADPGVLNVFPEYQLRTPGKYTGSLAVVFGKSGLISFDYSYKDYSNTEFDSEFGNYFSGLNNAIENNLQGASSFRLGGEYRIMDWSLRGGYHFQQSPYQDEEIMGNLNGFSAGFGYDFGNIELDFAYTRSERDSNRELYQTGLTDRALVENTNSNYILSLTFGF
jgi:long-subunit fatty acid transport protein